jgi:hypothetical protein
MRQPRGAGNASARWTGTGGISAALHALHWPYRCRAPPFPFHTSEFRQFLCACT